MKKAVLKEVENSNEPFPTWELNYGGQKENLGNQVCKVIDQIDKIYEKTNGDVEILIELQPTRNKPHLKGILFGGKPYFDKIKIV